MKSRVNREVQARFCERFGGEIPPYLLDFYNGHFVRWRDMLFKQIWLCVGYVRLLNVHGYKLNSPPEFTK